MKKNILVIEESDLVRRYLTAKLQEYGFEVVEAKTGFEGLMKLKNSQPDLVMMEYILPRTSGVELLEEKFKAKGIADIPVVMFTSKVDKEKILSVAKYKVARFFSKPLRIDTLMRSISELLGVEIALDTSPCTIDVHLNEQILFIEVAQGLNREKIELMGYKITEIIRLYRAKNPRVLIIVTGVSLSDADHGKAASFFRTVQEATGAPLKAMKLLTTSEDVKKYVAGSEKLSELGIAANLSEAMDQLTGIKVSDFIEEGYAIMRDDLLASRGALSESIQINFEADKGFSIAVVDDDMVSRTLVATAFGKGGWDVATFEDGKQFVDSLKARKFDLVFLDLMMPVMDGFAVLAHLKASDVRTPVIVFSSLSEKEAVVKAMSFGIKSYLAKPLTPDALQRKAVEILKTSF